MSHHDPHSEAADAVHEGRPVEAQYTKQGRGGRRISIEMGIAIVLTVVGFAVVFLFLGGAFRGDNTSAESSVDAAAIVSEGTTTPTPDAPTTATGQPTAPTPD
ncbi:hypothetical protein [Brevundimonas subvibrioides]|uniref:hypothetical protein n=1 Tax=Brevundimonas subvibrioides TaxID=74313 RepID=UPI0022B56D49|nr:hypothetical protein [Brevundimonas subvibrioides]